MMRGRLCGIGEEREHARQRRSNPLLGFEPLTHALLPVLFLQNDWLRRGTFSSKRNSCVSVGLGNYPQELLSRFPLSSFWHPRPSKKSCNFLLTRNGLGVGYLQGSGKSGRLWVKAQLLWEQVVRNGFIAQNAHATGSQLPLGPVMFTSFQVDKGPANRAERYVSRHALNPAGRKRAPQGAGGIQAPDRRELQRDNSTSPAGTARVPKYIPSRSGRRSSAS